MEIKDWLLLIVPIVSNGIILYFFQRCFEKRQDLRNDVIKVFWNKLQELNDAFIQANIETMKTEELEKSKIVNKNLMIIQEFILELIKYYDTNQYDLKVFAIFFNDLQKKWQDFQDTCNEYRPVNIDDEIKLKLGEKLQLVKEANQKLINEVRDKY